MTSLELGPMLKSVKNAFGKTPPDLAIILGSGLGNFSGTFKNAKTLSYEDIPGFPLPSIKGHEGELVMGEVGRKNVLAFRGRFHFYEGHPMDVTALPARLAGAWGIKNLVVSNAAGGIKKGFKLGTMMIISDHLNFLGHNPLRGANLSDYGPRFVDMTTAYDESFRKTARAVAKELELPFEEGVYAAFPGPTYETPAEIHMLRTIGADAVGMSTVPEVIVARHHGMKVFGISCITNLAAGSSGQKVVNHEEVIETTKRVEKTFADFLKTWIERASL